MQVILLQDVKDQGKKGDLINVSDGYARNYLIPRKLARRADAASLTDIKNREESKRFREEQAKKEALALKEKLEALVVVLHVQLGADGKAYGSVGGKDISEELKKKYDLDIDKKKIEMDAVRACGKYEATVRIHAGVHAALTVMVEPK